MKKIISGASLESGELVTPSNCASAVGSGLLDVYSTPSMVALIEKTCYQCLEQFLHSHESSVGGEVNIRHMKPTAIGQPVLCRAEITEVAGKKVAFEVLVTENGVPIGKGTHTRFVIDKEAFIKSIT